MIEDPMPIDLTPKKLAELVTSNTRRRLLSRLEKLMMDLTEPYEPTETHLVIEIATLDDDIKNHFTSVKQIQDATDRLRKEYLPMFDRYGIVEYDREEDRIRTTKNTMLFATAINEIEDAVETDETSETTGADDAEEAAKAWLSTAIRRFA